MQTPPLQTESGRNVEGCTETPDSLEARLQLGSPAAGAEAEWDGERLARPAPPGLGDSGGASGRPRRERTAGRAAPTPGPAAQGLRNPPWGQRPAPAAPPAARRPFRSKASDPRNSQLQPLVGRRRHPAPPPPSSSVRRPRPAPPPRLRLYRSPWHGGRSAQPGPTPLHAPPARRTHRRRPGTNLVRALGHAGDACRRGGA